MASSPAPVVLITRPVGAASERLRDALEAAGYTVHSQPMLRLQAYSALPAAARAMLRALDQYHHIIFVSANAVQFGLEFMAEHWPQWPSGPRWYAVGGATAALLAEHDISALAPGQNMTAEGLLGLPQLSAVRAQRVLIVKGEGGRDTLRVELTRRGAQVDELACYRRLPVQLPPAALATALARWQVQVVLISSGEGMANLVELLSPAETNTLDSLCIIVPSQRVADMARAMGCKNIITAENASDAAMLRALEAHQPCPGE